jgi:hypothetical protein
MSPSAGDAMPMRASSLALGSGRIRIEIARGGGRDHQDMMRGEVRRRDSDSIRPRERPRSIQSGHAGASDHVPESGSGAAAELDRTLAKARAPRPHHVRSLLESGGPGQPAPRSGTAGQASRVRVRSAHVHAWNQPFTVHAPTVDERRIVQPQGSGQSYRGYGTITYISPQSRHHQPQTRTPANACAPPRPRLVTERHTAGAVASLATRNC